MYLHPPRGQNTSVKSGSVQACRLKLPIASLGVPNSLRCVVSKTPSVTHLAEQKLVQGCTYTPFHGPLDDLIVTVTKLAGTAIAPDAPLMSAGFDSVTAAELSNQLNRRLRMELPSTLLFDHPCINSIAEFLQMDCRESITGGETQANAIRTLSQ